MDAPVVKSKPAAIAGKLGIYMGGDEATCEAMRPILALHGREHHPDGRITARAWS